MGKGRFVRGQGMGHCQAGFAACRWDPWICQAGLALKANCVSIATLPAACSSPGHLALGLALVDVLLAIHALHTAVARDIILLAACLSGGAGKTGESVA